MRAVDCDRDVCLYSGIPIGMYYYGRDSKKEKHFLLSTIRDQNLAMSYNIIKTRACA